MDSLNTRKQSIGGFLSFYLFIVGIAALTPLFNLINFNIESDYSGSWLLAMSDIIIWFLYSGLCVYVIAAFCKRLPNAYHLAITQLIMLVVMNGLLLAVRAIDSSSPSSFLDEPRRLVVSLVQAAVFFIYLSTSERVNNLIPKETRRFYKADKIIIIGGTVLILVLFSLGMLDIMMW